METPSENESNSVNQTPQPAQIDGSNNNNTRGSFRNHNRRNHNHNHNHNRGGRFNNRQHQGNARPHMNNFHNHNHNRHPHGFLNGGAPNFVVDHPQRPMFPQFVHPSFPHHFFSHASTSPTPHPHFGPVQPFNHPQYSNLGMPVVYNGQHFHQDSAGFYGPLPPPPPMMEHLPLMNVVRGPALRPPHQAVQSLVQGLPESLPSLSRRIQNQIDYYFSEKNLVGDHYLKGLMDEQGWVPVQKIKEFNMVKQMTSDSDLILSAMRSSLTVEVQGDKIRRRGDWMNYVVTTTISEIQAGINNIRLDSKSGEEEPKAQLDSKSEEVQKADSEG